MHITLISNQVIRLEDAEIKFDEIFSYKDNCRKFNWRTRKMEDVKYTAYLYFKKDTHGVYFRSGFAPYLLYHFMTRLDEPSKVILRNLTASDFHYEFQNLRDYQTEDVKQLTKFRRGIFSVYTGYGKTQIIAQLINYIVKERKERLIVITPNSKSLEEIKSRVRSLYGIESNYFDYESNYNAININGFLRSNNYNKSNPYWTTVKWIIADECEYCLTDKSIGMMNLCTNLEYSYAFSGTADKSSADRILMREGMTDVVKRNKLLIGFFGFSIVYKKPENFSIDFINVKTSIFNDVSNIRMTENQIYAEIVKEIFVNKRFCDGFKKIVQREKGGIYIPLGRLEVINYWLQNVLTWKDGLMANICGAGIQLWSEGKHIKDISLDDLKRLVEEERIEVILGTQSSYRAIDLPKLNKIILLTSQIASNVLQQIGRVARGRRFQVFNLIPTCYISCYTSDLRKRNNLIKSYYSDCNIRSFMRSDRDYGIF